MFATSFDMNTEESLLVVIFAALSSFCSGSQSWSIMPLVSL